MQYNITTQNVKKSVKNLSSFFKDKGYSIKYSDILEAFSYALFIKNYNTLEAKMKQPISINDVKEQYKYMVEIEADIHEKKMLEIIKNSLQQANCLSSFENFVCINNDSYNHFSFVLNLEHSSNNTLTSFYCLAENIKKLAIPRRMDFCRIHVEKESLMEFFNTNCNKQVKM